jgi:hypothetical protein
MYSTLHINKASGGLERTRNELHGSRWNWEAIVSRLFWHAAPAAQARVLMDELALLSLKIKMSRYSIRRPARSPADGYNTLFFGRLREELCWYVYIFI